MAWLTGWSYRKEITITGQSGAGTNYQVKLDIGDSAGGNFHLEGHCTNFPQDIQVTDNDGTTQLDYWIEDITADPLKMWVEVADDLGSNQTIYIYYGKSGATTDSDIETTFLLGDDFPGSSIDTGKWNVTGTVGVGSSEATLNEDDKILSIATFGFETAITAKSKADEQDSSFVGYTTDANNRFEVVNSDSGSNDNFDNIMIAALKGGNWAGWILNDNWDDFRNTYYQYELKRISTSLMEYSQGANSNTYTNSTYIPTGDMSAGIYVWDSSQASTLICDWIYVRKCIATEPAFSSAGSEETEHIHTYDTAARVAPNDLDPMTVSVTPTTGATVLVLAIMTGSSNGRTGGAPTFNGVALTQIESMVSGTNEITVEMWYLINPSIGTYNVSVPNTFNKDIALIVSVYKARAGYTSAFDVSDSNTSGSTQNTSITVTPTVNGDVIVEAMGHGYSTIPSANNRTKLYSVDEGVWTDNHQYALQDTAAAIEFTWTVGGFDDLAQILVAFKEVTIPITGHPWYYERRQ